MQINVLSVNSFRQLGHRDSQEDARYPNIDSPDPAAYPPFFVVCDGVGGMDDGEVASQTVCDAFAYNLATRNWLQPFSIADFNHVLNEAYDALERDTEGKAEGMATTLAFVAFHEGGCMAAHIGDSRIYQIRPEEGIVYRSEDHSLVNTLVRTGQISPIEAENYPQRNVITRCMRANAPGGQRDEATIINITDVMGGDYFLLCTDGVTAAMNDDEIFELLSTDLDDETKLNIIARQCAQSSDNNTAILVHIDTVDTDNNDTE